jgi:hypothetical protein
MMLAQDPPPSATAVVAIITAISTMLLMILTQAGKMWSDYRKDKRDQIDESHKQEYLRRIADSNEAQWKNLSDLNTHLTVRQRLDDDRHTANVQTMQTICKANCPKQNT